MNRFHRIINHLKNRTLHERIQWEWRQYVRRRHVRRWDAQAGKRAKFDVQLQVGVKIRLYFDSKLSHLIYCYEFEWKERHFLKAFLRPGDFFVDIGANIGLFTLVAARYVGPSGKVYAFEPDQKVYQRLRENIKLNRFNQIQSYQLAFSDAHGTFPFFSSQDGHDAWNSFAMPIEGKIFVTDNVTCRRWDDFAQDHKLVGKVTMMKIDVEGWESKVLNGALKTLSRKDAPVLQVEFTEEAARSANSSCAELYYILKNMGYQIFTYDEKARSINVYSLREAYPHLNVIAAKDPNYVRNRLRKKSVLRWLS